MKTTGKMLMAALAASCWLPSALHAQGGPASLSEELGPGNGDQSFSDDARAAGREIADELKRLRLDGRSAFVLHDNRGLRALLDGDAAGAVRSFQSAVAARPDYADGYDHLALASERAGDLEGALKAYSYLMEKWPAMADHYAAKRGAALLTTGRYDLALQDLDRAISRSPGRTSLLQHKSMALLELGRGQEAAALYQKALTMDPTLKQYSSGICGKFKEKRLQVPACEDAR